MKVFPGKSCEVLVSLGLVTAVTKQTYIIIHDYCMLSIIEMAGK